MFKYEGGVDGLECVAREVQLGKGGKLGQAMRDDDEIGVLKTERAHARWKFRQKVRVIRLTRSGLHGSGQP
jgi:hypothetical protein